MKKTLIKRLCIPVFFAAFFFIIGGAVSADPPPDEGGAWFAEIDAISRLPQSVNVEDIQFEMDSFFDVFVEVVLREGLPAGAQDDLGTALSSDDVTDIILEQGPELYETLRLVLPDGDEISVAPGAAAHQWDPEGRWNRGPHTFDIYNWVSVNQWIRASMSSSKLVWKVFKPGEYSSDCMYLNVHSNANMRLTLDNFGPLIGDDGTEGVATAYALSEYIRTPKDLVLTGREMAGATPVIDWVPDGESGEQEVGPHTLVKVWNSIRVGSSLSPGFYATPDGPSAVITVAPTL